MVRLYYGTGFRDCQGGTGEFGEISLSSRSVRDVGEGNLCVRADQCIGTYTNHRAKVHKKHESTRTPSLRFPLPAGGTERARGAVPLAKRGEPAGGGVIDELWARGWYYIAPL